MPTEDFEVTFNPFRDSRLEGEKISPRKRELLQRVEQMDLGPGRERANAKVRELTVKDLNDLAASFAGVPTENPAVKRLTMEDLRNIEEVFFDFKLDVARVAGSSSIDNIDDLAAAVDVSCCCCTPCCCCAAAVTEPVAI